LLALLAVGRIMRCRKLSGGLAPADGDMGAGFRRGGGPKVADGLRETLADCEAPYRFDIEGLEEATLYVLGRRERMPLMGRSKEGVSERLAAEEAVGATRCAGRLMGRVGDFGRGFTKPVAERMPSVCG
jgi:hypothetical protein